VSTIPTVARAPKQASASKGGGKPPHSQIKPRMAELVGENDGRTAEVCRPGVVLTRRITSLAAGVAYQSGVGGFASVYKVGGFP